LKGVAWEPGPALLAAPEKELGPGEAFSPWPVPAEEEFTVGVTLTLRVGAGDAVGTGEESASAGVRVGDAPRIGVGVAIGDALGSPYANASIPIHTAKRRLITKKLKSPRNFPLPNPVHHVQPDL